MPDKNQTLVESFGALADGLRIGLALSNSQGLIRYGNVTFSEVLDILPGSPDEVFLLERIASGSRRDFESALHHAQWMPVGGKLELLSRVGKLRTFQVSLSPFGQPGREPHIWILAHEVTELIETGRALSDSEGSVHLLSARLLQAQDAERRRMARDLHDITGQELAVILMSLTRLSNGLSKPGFDSHAELAEAVALVRKVESEIRTLSYILHPPMLDELGLKSALGWYIDGFSKRSKIAIEMAIPKTLPRLSRDKEIAIFRVVQESLTNVLRHAHSKTARIRAKAEGGFLTLSVEDAGRGFTSQSLGPNKSGKVVLGVGILGMRERLQQLGGALEIESTSIGTQVLVRVPLDEGHTESVTDESLSEMALSALDAGQSASLAASHEPSPRRILVADDHELMRLGIRNLLEVEKDLDVCGEAKDGLEAVARVRELRPDLVIMDLIMPRLGGFSAAQQIRHLYPSTKILIFTNYAYGPVEAMIRATDCQGYVSKARASTDLIRAIRAVLAGDNFFDPTAVRTKSA